MQTRALFRLRLGGLSHPPGVPHILRKCDCRSRFSNDLMTDSRKFFPKNLGNRYSLYKSNCFVSMSNCQAIPRRFSYFHEQLSLGSSVNIHDFIHNPTSTCTTEGRIYCIGIGQLLWTVYMVNTKRESITVFHHKESHRRWTTPCLLDILPFVISSKDVNFPWLKVKFSDFSQALK